MSAFIDVFAPFMQDLIRSCRSQMERLLPQAVQLVYDNYSQVVPSWLLAAVTLSSAPPSSASCWATAFNGAT